MISLLSWNTAGRDLWQLVSESDVAVALLQEVRSPAAGAALEVLPDDERPWLTEGWPPRPFRTAVARTSDRVALRLRPTTSVNGAAGQPDWAVSREGTLTAADVLVDGEVRFTAVSVYAPWERTPGGDLYADASAHRLLSDLSVLMLRPQHRLLVAGDWNVLLGYAEPGWPSFVPRYRSVFDRAAALGLRFVGPQAPDGRQADPWPEELPRDSRNVPTYHHSGQTPATATRQLDFVFASETLAGSVRVRALNEVAEWGGSDHCRLRIEVDV